MAKTDLYELYFKSHNINVYYINLNKSTCKDVVSNEKSSLLKFCDDYINNCNSIRFDGKSINKFFTSIKNNMPVSEIEFTRKDFNSIRLEYKKINEYSGVLYETPIATKIDKLTGLYNSNEFINDLEKYHNLGLEQENEEKLTLITFDINGLKATNDTFGHIEGDNLIKGSAENIIKTFGKYGKCYRTGGDEITCIVFVSLYELDSKIKFLYELLRSYKTEQINGISISYGYASQYEFPKYSMLELRKESDTRLYENKRAFYENKKARELIKKLEMK